MGSAAFQFACFQYLKVQIFNYIPSFQYECGITYDRLLQAGFDTLTVLQMEYIRVSFF